VTVEVEPATEDQLAALVEGAATFQEHFGFSVGTLLDVFPGALERSLDGVRSGDDPTWGTHLFIDAADAAIVGFGGYKGPPVDGAVEIGYAVDPAYEGRGVATGAATALVERARARGVERCLAHTRPETNASNTVLQRCGFTFAGAIDDPNAGPVWRWELAL
jgi:RimJ/RimL family protein N-acetyltransferase